MPRRPGAARGSPINPANQESGHGHQTKRLAAAGQGAGRLFHWNGPRRAAVPGTRSGACGRRQRHLRARRAHGLAHPSARPDPDRDVGPWMGSARGRADRGHPAGRRGLVCARREALARRDAYDGDDAYCGSGKAGWQGRRLDGTRQRPTIPQVMMGRFASTASLSEDLRPPYPPLFFRAVAQKLDLSSAHALIDLGTGPGLLALGFAPYVGRIVGVDPEPAMIAAARKAAARASQPLTLIEGRAEDLPADIGSFDVVTIGRALHWMDRDATLARLERLVAPNGLILVCASFSAMDGHNPWLDAYNTARHAWSKESLWSESG